MTTLPALLLERAAQSPTKVAIRSHGLGIWTPLTWADLLARVERVGDGLASLGVGRGSVVALISGNRVEWVVTDLATQGLGAATFAIDPDSSPTAVVTALRSTPLAAIVVEDQEQYDKVVDGGVTGVPIVVCDTRGVRHLDDSRRDDADRQLTFAQLESRATSRGAWRSAAASVEGSTAAVVVPGGSAIRVLDHAALLAEGRRVADAIGLGAKDELFPQHTFANLVERSFAITGALTSGLSVALGQTSGSPRSKPQRPSRRSCTRHRRGPTPSLPISRLGSPSRRASSATRCAAASGCARRRPSRPGPASRRCGPSGSSRPSRSS